MKTLYTEKGRQDLHGMDSSLAKVFIKHADKIAALPPRRHMKFGMPFHVDEVGNGRLIYTYKDEALYIVRCFVNHNDYEKWYRSYR